MKNHCKMCDHELLLEKFIEHRKVHDRFLKMFGTLFETAQSMKLLAADITSNYDAMFLQLRMDSSPLVEPPPQKRRKAHSFDSPATIRPDATHGRVDDAIDSSMVRNKSDPEVSTYSLLNENIDLPDSEESFFALTQSPPARDPLSPRRDISGQATNIQSTPPRVKPALKKDQTEVSESTEKKRKKQNLSLSGRFSTSFHMSPETNKQLRQLPVRQKMTTPKVKVDQQENLAPVGKWTAKKSAPSSVVGRNESSAAALKRTPTSTSKDSTASLLNRTRLRQTKLRFPDNKSSAADDNETYFDEFVVPSPATSFSGSRFFKSMRKKEQSSLIAAPPASAATSNAARDEDDDVFKSPEAKPRKAVKPVVYSDDDNFDIDQTYFSEAENDLSRALTSKVVRVKQEPSSQAKLIKSKILAMDTVALEQGILDSSGVEIIKPRSQENVITIDESQPSRTDIFMEAIREEQRREQASRKTILDAMGPPLPTAIRKPTEAVSHPFRSSPLRKFNTFGGGGVAAPKPAPPPAERRCIECTKHYRILEIRGMAPDEIRSKLARNCRECRQAQLHETPPGFWNPEFSPTQRI